MNTAALDLRAAGRGGVAAASVLGGALLLGVLAVLTPVLALATVLALIFVGVTLHSLPAGLAVFTVLTFFERIPGVGGSATLVKVAGAVLALSWLLALTRRRQGVPLLLRDHPLLSYALIGLCGFAAASMLWAPDVEIAQFNAFRLAQVVVFFFIVYTAVRERRHVRWLVLAFVSGAVLTALVGLAGATSSESFDPGQETSRLVGQIGDPNELAAILVPALAFVLFSLAAFRAPLLRWLLGTFALVLAVALFLTESRGGLVGLFVMSLAAVGLAGRFRPRAVAAVLTVAALGVSYYTLVAPPQSLQRITNFTAEGGTGRTDLWSIAVEVAKDHPVVGVGIGNFVVVEPVYASRDIAISEVRLVVDTPKIAHNMYLQVLSELGLIGLALFLVILATSLSLAWRAIRMFARAGDFELEMIARGVIVGLFGMLAAYAFISAQYEKQLWLLFGLSTALYAVARRPGLDDRGSAG